MTSVKTSLIWLRQKIYQIKGRRDVKWVVAADIRIMIILAEVDLAINQAVVIGSAERKILEKAIEEAGYRVTKD